MTSQFFSFPVAMKNSTEVFFVFMDLQGTHKELFPGFIILYLSGAVKLSCKLYLEAFQFFVNTIDTFCSSACHGKLVLWVIAFLHSFL